MMSDSAQRRLVRRTCVAAALFFLALALLHRQVARADDQYDSAFARSVRAATEHYRLALWALNDGYVQTTDYVAGFGLMYTNHDRFDPADLAHPTMLVYNEAGQLVAVGYQFAHAPYPSAFAAVPRSAWYSIPKHVHYNVASGGAVHYGQAPWDSNDPPTADALRAHKYMPADGKLLFAFVHPAVRAIVVWAWLANPDGLFAGDNPAAP